MGGLGALLVYLGGGWVCGNVLNVYQISQIKLIHKIKHTRRCNCKQQKRKRLKSHYIACNTDVSHISGKHTLYRRYTTVRRRRGRVHIMRTSIHI